MPSKSKKQQRFFGMVRGLQKGDTKPSDVSKDVKDAAKDMKKKDVKDFAKTKHKGLPNKVKKESTMKLMDLLKEESSLKSDITSKYRGYLRSSLANDLKRYINMNITAKDVKLSIDGNKLIFELPDQPDSLWKGKFSVKLSDKDLGKFVKDAEASGIDADWRGNEFVYSNDPKKLSDFFIKKGVKHAILKNGKGVRVSEKR